jgi:tRNA isopentenyl-2-thiomethyl-A-37 hydroxylase MiaE
MSEQRSRYWRLNWYRQSELEGALLLGRLTRHVSDPDLVRRLTRHCADESRHALLWSRTLEALGLPIVRIRRSYQSFYLDETPAPRTLVEVLALTHVFEQRVHAHFTHELQQPGWPERVRRTFRTMLKDERGHLDWIAQWLATQPEASVILHRYRRADERLVQRLTPYGERLWEIEGLGEELDVRVAIDDGVTEEECHAVQPQHPA